MKHYQITRAAELESLGDIRDFIDTACANQPGLEEQVVYHLKLAVDEACANLIEHGYAGLNPGSMILELEFTPAQVSVRLTDFGHAFEPAEIPLPDLETAVKDGATSGFGLFIIYQTMDEVDYKTDGFCNQLKLVKRLKR